MKSYEVKYIKGHLVDGKSGKRIFLRRGGSFNILGDDDQFVEKDELHNEREPLQAEQKEKELEQNHKGYFLHKIADAGAIFVFRIGLSKKNYRRYCSRISV